MTIKTKVGSVLAAVALVGGLGVATAAPATAAPHTAGYDRSTATLRGQGSPISYYGCVTFGQCRWESRCVVLEGHGGSIINSMVCTKRAR